MTEDAPASEKSGGIARPARTDLLRYVEEPRALVPGHAVRLLHCGREAFPAWLEAIERAQKRISMEMYIFNADRTGRTFGDALVRAARRGVEVRLLYDFVGGRDAPASFFADLRLGGVHVIAYHKYRWGRPRFWTLWRRNHRKTLVCDGIVAHTGGVNIADEWAAPPEGGDWADAAIEVRGPAVALLEANFLRTWNRRARKSARLDAATLSRPAAAGDVPLAVISNTELLDRFSIRRAALHAIRESRERLYLANPYFVPDPGILRALRQAARRGVDVRILVPERSDVRILDLASRATFRRLLRDGVRIFQSERVVHTKALLVDDGFLSIGSYNLDHRSLAYNLEVVVNVVDRPTGARFRAMFEKDLGGAIEISAEDWANRPLVLRLLQRLAYRLRLWL